MMNLKCILLFFISIVTFGQSYKKDSIISSLETKVFNTNNDTIKVDTYIKLGNHYLYSDFLKAKQYYEKGLVFIEKSENGFEHQKATILGLLGVISKRKGEFPLAMEYYLESKEMFETLKDSVNVTNILHNIAMIYRDQRSYEEALKVFKKVIKFKNKLKDTIGEGIAYNMQGVVYRKLRQIDSASTSYAKAKQLFIKAKSFENIPRVNSNLAALYHYKKEYKKAIDLHSVNINYFTRKNNLTSLFNSFFNISKTYLVLKEYEYANNNIDKAIAIAKKMELKDKLSRAYLRKSSISSEIGNYKRALVYHKLHKKYSDSIYNKNEVRKLQKLELTYEYEKQRLKDSVKYASEKKIIELEKDKAQTENYLYMLSLLLAILSAVAFIYVLKRYYVKQNKKEIEKFKDKEAALKAHAKYLLDKIDSQKEEIKRSREEGIHQKINEHTKNLHDKIAEKILTQDDWYSFKEKFNQVYPLFFKTIKDKGILLTKSEERLVSLEKLGLDNNQIAKVLGISVDSVFVNRYRLRKKNNAPNTISLVKFLETYKK